MKWYTKPGIPGCWGESGVYYDATYSEEARERLEKYWAELERRRRIRDTVCNSLAAATTILLLVLAAFLTIRSGRL